jgi:hypothetical protein
MALETFIWSTWRRQTSIRSRQAAGRIIAGLRDLGDATFLLWTITSRVRDSIPDDRLKLAAPRADAGPQPTRQASLC